MFETDGSIMIFWQALGESKEGGQSNFFKSNLFVIKMGTPCTSDLS